MQRYYHVLILQEKYSIECIKHTWSSKFERKIKVFGNYFWRCCTIEKKKHAENLMPKTQVVKQTSP